MSAAAKISSKAGKHHAPYSFPPHFIHKKKERYHSGNAPLSYNQVQNFFIDRTRSPNAGEGKFYLILQNTQGLGSPGLGGNLQEVEPRWEF